MGKDHSKFGADNQPPAHWLDSPFPWAAKAGKLIIGAFFGLFSFYFLSHIALFSLPLPNLVLPLAASLFLAYLGYLHLFSAMMRFIFGESRITSVNIVDVKEVSGKKVDAAEYKDYKGLLGIPYKTTVAELEDVLRNELERCLVDNERDQMLIYMKLFARKMVENPKYAPYLYPSAIKEISAKDYVETERTNIKNK